MGPDEEGSVDDTHQQSILAQFGLENLIHQKHDHESI